ncbi:MAG: GNAT family N-acetyltransferase [Aquitalea sp.]|nr:GNAT family N-acetyltransferase [Aquitalea sp.]
MTDLDISHDPARLDRDMILHFLTEQAHWAAGMDAALLERAIRHSLVIGAYDQGRQIGFARVVTDYASFAYLSDVFVLPEWRGRKVGQAMINAAIAHPQLQQLRRFLLVSRDARGFYRRLGFGPLQQGERYMELRQTAARPQLLRWPFILRRQHDEGPRASA